MDFMANGLLALGAHPAMVHSVEELDVAPFRINFTMGPWERRNHGRADDILTMANVPILSTYIF